MFNNAENKDHVVLDNSTKQSGTLGAGAYVEVDVSNLKPPFTITIDTAAAGKKIEFSTNDKVSYFTPAYDTSAAGQLVTHADSPISHVKITGANGDIWSIR